MTTVPETSIFHPEDKAELTRLEQAMWRAETRLDLAFQEARFAPDFLEFGRSGRVYNRAQIIRTDRWGSRTCAAKLHLVLLPRWVGDAVPPGHTI